jgi:hypothetical protein
MEMSSLGSSLISRSNPNAKESSMPTKTTVAFLEGYQDRKTTSFVWARKHYEEADTNESLEFYWERMMKAAYLVMKTIEEKHKLLNEEYRPTAAVFCPSDYYWRRTLGQQTYLVEDPYTAEIDMILEFKKMGVDVFEVSSNPCRLAEIKAAAEAKKKKRKKKGMSKTTAAIIEEGKRLEVQAKIQEFLHGPKQEDDTYIVKRGMCLVKDGDKIVRVLKITKLPYIEPTEVQHYY